MIDTEIPFEFDFGNAEDLDLGFDAALEDAAFNWGEEAAAAVSSYMREAREAGDFTLLAQRTMALGAMACMHSHLEEFSTSLGAEYGADLGLDQPESAHDNHDECTTCHKDPCICA